MRWCRFIPLVVLLSAFGASVVCAEPLIQTLSEDGAWVQFHVNLNVAGQKSTPVWTVKSVGKKEIAGVAHRWIELQSKEDERNVIIFKCLVSETEFGKGKNPLAHAHQVFVKFADQEPREVESLYVNGPAGGGGVTSSFRENVAIVPALISRELVMPRISFEVA